MLVESAPQSPLGSLILIGLLLFIVYRILYTLGSQQGPGGKSKGLGGKIFHLPDRKSGVPPVTARLIPFTGDKDPFGDGDDALEFHKILVEKGGLERIGDYTIQEMPEYTIRAFTHPGQSLVGIIYRDPSDRLWVNLLTEYKDGRIITTSSAESDAISLTRPYGMPLFNFPGIAIDQLLRRHKLETRGTEQAPPVVFESFPEYFAQNYSKVRAYIYEQEQKHSGQKPGAGAPVSLPDDQEGDKYKSQAGMEEALAENDDFIPSRAERQEWLKMIYKAINVPKEKQDTFQEGLVWIIDKADPQSIAETISEYTGIRIDQEPEGRLIIRSEAGAEDIIEPGDLHGSELFEKINSGLPANQKFSRLPVALKGVTFYSRMSLEF